ncbi:MAG: GGDEF domain-containing protein [Defluviitaleaceae bacterium]|nr:GGDEF domain-containing protein [Defluviitaleaceae bacterium]
MYNVAEALSLYMKKILDGRSDAVLNMDEIPDTFHTLAKDLAFFGSSFNTIVDQLSKRQKELEEEALLSKQKNTSIEQFGMLISSLIQYIPQQILVLEKGTNAILLMNEAAISEMHRDHDYIENLTALMVGHTISAGGTQVEVSYVFEGAERHLFVLAYSLVWEDKDAILYTVADMSETKKEIKTLEIFAYQDHLTGLYNRTFGMRTLEEWLVNKRAFVLLFADLDKLKYINDVFGHDEGDTYIITAAKHLRGFPENSVVCRLGGDEFMVLIPDVNSDEVQSKASEIYTALETDPYLEDKEFTYSMSYGFVSVDTDNELPAKYLLSTADERMYANKRARKKERLN